MTFFKKRARERVPMAGNKCMILEQGEKQAGEELGCVG